MAIQLECDQCGESLSLKDNVAGKKVRCRCGTVITVPKFETVIPLDDDGSDDALLLKRGSRGSRGSRTYKVHEEVDGDESNPMVKVALIAGGGAVAFLVLILVAVKAFKSPPGPQSLPDEVVQTNQPRPVAFSSQPSAVPAANQGANNPPRTGSGFKPPEVDLQSDDNQAAQGGAQRKKRAGFQNTNGENAQQAGANKKGGFNRPGNDGNKKTDWGDGAATHSIVGTAGQKSNIRFPDLSNDVVLVDDELFDIEKQTALGKFSVTLTDNNVLRAISPDGRLLASADKSSIQSPEVISLHSLGASGFGKMLATNVRGQQNNQVKFLAFLSKDRLAAGIELRGAVRGSKLFIFNLETGKIAKDFTTSEFGDTTVLSSDGKYLANHHREAIFVYDMQKGVKVASMERPKGLEQTIFMFGDCNGLAFSPDNTELAALINRNRIVVWSANGKIVFDETLAREMSRGFSHDADGLQWLPDGKSWLLGNQFLFDRESKLIVWELKRTWYLDKQPVRVFDQDHVIAAVGNNSAGDLVKQQIPWEEINRQTDPELLDSIALVKPGEPMSIEVQVFNVRFGSPQEVANLLGTSLTKRIEQSKFKVVQGQNVVLKATYNEEQGEQKRVVQGIGFGTDTGQRVNDTKGKLDIKITTRDTGEVAWSQSIYSDGGLFIEGEITDASVRNRMFKFIEARVNQLALPTLIPKPGAVSLPIVTNLEQ